MPLRELLDGIAAGISGDRALYFDELVDGMCSVTGAEFGFVGRCTASEKAIRTISVYMCGQRGPNFTYDLDGTPCSQVLSLGAAIYEQSVKTVFPDDHLLLEIGAESYVGTRLEDNQGKTIGLIALVSRTPIASGHVIQAMQTIFSIPAALELERWRERGEKLSLEQRLDSILSIAEEAIIGVDSNFSIVLFNEGAQNIFGYTEQEILGAPINALLPSEFRDRHQDMMRQFLNGEEVSRLMNQRSGELFAVRKDGTEFPVEASITKIERHGRKSVTVVMRDITERKQSEVALRYGQRMQTLGNMVAGLAHDFNNILTLIHGSIELSFLEAVSAEERERHLMLALKEVDRGADLVSRMMSFGKTPDREPVVVNPGLLVDQLMDMLELSIGEGIETSYVRDRELGNVFVDPSQLENALVNLALNARDAMLGGGILKISLKNVCLEEPRFTMELGIEPGTYVCIAVRDNGRGMDEHTRRNAFEPFFSTRREKGGTGLGLSMVYGFVSSSGGGVHLLSEEGVGTSVLLYLPSVTVAETPSIESIDDSLIGGDETILVVEDHEQIRALAVLYANSLGYKVIEAENGQRAFDVLDSGKAVDLVFTDFQMPGGISGLEVGAHARKLGVPSIITTGYGDVGPTAADFSILPKPYSRHSLATLVRRTLDRATAN